MIAQVVVYPTTIQSRTRRPPGLTVFMYMTKDRWTVNTYMINELTIKLKRPSKPVVEQYSQ
jgi:hypothetical protein